MPNPRGAQRLATSLDSLPPLDLGARHANHPRFHITANGREDDTLGEVFIQWGKQGTTGAGLMDVYAVALSVGLQHRVPLVDLIRDGLDLYFAPNGRTNDPEIPRARSVVDYLARRLAIDWLPHAQRSELSIYTIEERMVRARDWMRAEDARLSTTHARPGSFGWDLTNGVGNPAGAAR